MDYSKILLVFVSVILSSPNLSLANLQCCKGENVLVNKRCIDGSKISALSCADKYAFENDMNNSIIDQEDNLIIQHSTNRDISSKVSQDRYCVSKFNGSDRDIYIICFDKIAYKSDRSYIFIPQFISVFFIILTIIIYLQLPDILDLQGLCMLHSIAGLAISYLDLGLNQVILYGPSNELCLASAYILYFSSLYSFFWLNVLSFHIWRTVVKPKYLNFRNYWPHLYHAYGIGGPTILVVILAIAQHSSLLMSSRNNDAHPGFAEGKCWFKTMKTEFIYFYGPMTMLISLNIIYFAWTIVVLWKDISKCNEKHIKVLKYRLMLCVKLFFVMGITWVFEVLSAAFQDTHYAIQVFWWITDSFNAMQGTLIFFILVVFRSKVLRGLAQRSLCGIRLPSRWRTLSDDECDEIEEEFGLSETQAGKQ